MVSYYKSIQHFHQPLASYCTVVSYTYLLLEFTMSSLDSNYAF